MLFNLLLSKSLNKCGPAFPSNSSIDLLEDLYDFIFIHNGVERAEVPCPLRLLPAFLVPTFCELSCVRHVLPEVEIFSWVDLAAHRFVEVLVGYFAIPVVVEEVPHPLELGLREVEPPMLQVKL